MMLTVGNLMSKGVVTIGPEATLREALTLFAERRISAAPVVSAGRVLGVVSLTDLVDMATARYAPAAAAGGRGGAARAAEGAGNLSSPGAMRAAGPCPSGPCQ